MESVKVFIDNIETRLPLVKLLKQPVPFPGGVSFSIDIGQANLKKDFRDLPVGIYNSINVDLEAKIFWYLERLIYRHEAADEIANYFLNKVNFLSVTDSHIHLEGECSKVLK